MFIEKSGRQLRSLADEIGTDLAWLALWAIGVIVWLFFGSLIAAPYTWAAQGNPEHFALTAALAPFSGFILLVAWVVNAVMYRRNVRRGGASGWFERYWFVGGVVVWLTLPIWCNLASVALRWVGLKTAARALFDFRYGSIAGAALFVMVLLFGAGIAGWVSEQRRRYLESRLRRVQRRVKSADMELAALHERKLDFDFDRDLARRFWEVKHLLEAYRGKEEKLKAKLKRLG